VIAHGVNVRIIEAPIQQSGTVGFGRQSPLQACQPNHSGIGVSRDA
jgi:hypothetical protein